MQRVTVLNPISTCGLFLIGACTSSSAPSESVGLVPRLKRWAQHKINIKHVINTTTGQATVSRKHKSHVYACLLTTVYNMPVNI